MTNRFLLLLCLAATTSLSWAEGESYIIMDSLKYVLAEDNPGYCRIMDVDAGHRLPVTEDSTLVIPASVTIEGRTYEISDIESDAFCNHLEIKHLIISEGISGIQEGAFRRCANLKSIHLPSSLY